jgi:hypothetical protein
MSGKYTRGRKDWDDESSDFDPVFSFDDIEPDYDVIERRRNAEIEHSNKLEEKRLERLRVRQELEEEERRRAQERRRRESEREAALAKKLQEDIRLYPERVERIKSDMKADEFEPDVKWPTPLTFDELRVDHRELELMHANLDLRDLADPIKDDYDSDSSINDFDAHFRGPARSANHRYKHHDKLDKLPPKFVLGERELLSDFGAGRLYKDLCEDFQKALSWGLYKYNKTLSNNLENVYTKRLRSYYQYIDWGEYESIDLLDGWTTLLRILLVIEPSRDINWRGRDVYNFISAIRSTWDCLLYTNKRLEEFSYTDTCHTEPKSRAIADSIQILRDSFLRSGTFLKVKANLEDRRDKFQAWFRSYELRDESKDTEEMRQISKNIVGECAQFFMEHPEDESVKLLRSFAYGRKRLDFNDVRMKWIDAITKIPEDVLSYRSKFWIMAAKHARVQRGQMAIKYYYR